MDAKNVLVAVSGLGDSDCLLEHVANYSWPRGTKFQVVHVVEPNEIFAHGFSTAQAAIDEGMTRAALVTDYCADSLKQKLPNFSIEKIVRQGVPVEEILTVASEWPAHLIMIGSHGKNTAGSLFLGSVSTRILTRSQCAVVVFRPERK